MPPNARRAAPRRGAFARVLLLGLCVASTALAQSPEAILRERIGMTSRRSASGRFIVFGPEELANSELASWADELNAKLEKTTGLKPDFSRRTLRIIVQEDGDPETAIVSGTQGMDAGTIVQRLIIRGYTNAVREDCEELLCRLLLNGNLFNFIDMSAGPPAKPESLTVPRWFSEGVIRNAFPAYRAHDRPAVVQRWKQGESGMLNRLLTSATNPPAAVLDRPLAATFVGWLLSQPDKTNRLNQVFARIASGEPLDAEWLAQVIPGCASGGDVNEAWENWLLHQTYVIRNPGKPTLDVVNRIRAEFILYRGDFGIPMTNGVCERVSIEQVIRERNGDWIPAFARTKIASFRFLAVGRGKDVSEVVEAYCRFLTALGESRDKDTLDTLLKKANDLLAALQRRVEAESRVATETPSPSRGRGPLAD